MVKYRIESLDFWKNAGYRALRTFCQVAIASIGTTALIQEVNWLVVGSTAGLAAILSILMSIVLGIPESGAEDKGENNE